MIRISETEDYRALIPFFIENGLEFEEGEAYGDDEIVRCWRVDGEGALVAACILARREGAYICDGIAVAPMRRGSGLGRRLLDLLVEEAARRGAERVFLVARAPGFFARAGFRPVTRDAAPRFFECFSCPQYGKTCHPEVMRLDIGGQRDAGATDAG
jgi:N-acetylglutamate synthase-like GNAT family acetyltransferase